MNVARVGQTFDYVEPSPGRIMVPLERRESSTLPASQHVQISRHDNRRMGWSEILSVFHSTFPGRWALMVFPPDGHVLDVINAYHLFVLDRPVDTLRLDK